jgi:hypothetical protein
MRFRVGLFFPVFIVVASVSSSLIFSGCSGGSSGSPAGGVTTPTPTPTPTPATPTRVKATILWGPRTRQSSDGSVGGPSSALSAKISLLRRSDNSTALTYDVNRGGITSGPGTYESTGLATPDTYLLRVEFYSLENGGGQLVGTAQASATLRTDGTLSTTIATSGTIQSVAVVPDQVIPLGTTRTVAFTAYSTVNQDPASVVAVTPGSAFVTVTSGTDKLSANGEEVTGLAPNRAMITVSLDDAISEATQVIIASNAVVTASPNPALVSIEASQQFTANIANDGPAGGPQGVTWELSDSAAGTLDSATGLFTASRNENPDPAAAYTITARSNYDTDKVDVVSLRVVSQVGVVITPNNANGATIPVSVRGTRNFTAAVSNVPEGKDAGVTWAVVGGSSQGAITQAGVYTAPATAGNYTITATSKFDPNKSASVVVNVQSGTVPVIVN